MESHRLGDDSRDVGEASRLTRGRTGCRVVPLVIARRVVQEAIAMAKRVFFRFHDQDVIDFGANGVRQHWLTKADREATAGRRQPAASMTLRG